MVFPCSTATKMINFWSYKSEYKRLNKDKIDLALRMEKETGYYIPDGKYWKKMNELDEKKIKKIDDLWLSSIKKI